MNRAPYTARLPGRNSPRWVSSNSPNVVFIDTHRVTLSAMEENVSYPIEDLRQGRDSKTPIPRFSMLSGKPIDNEQETENAARALFWQSYVAGIALMAVCAFILAIWPN